MVWVRALDGTAARAVPGTTGAWDVFWFSDSQTIGFFADNKLKAVDLNGTGTRSVCETGRFAGDGIPAPGGEILFRGPEGILRVASSGGVPSQVIATDRSKGELFLLPLVVLPDRRQFLYEAFMRSEQFVVRIGDLDSTVTTAAEDLTNLLGRVGGGLAFVAGRVVFSRGNVVLAQTLDDRSARPLGEPQPILTVEEKILTISASPMGVLVWSTGSFEEIKSPLVWLDGSGRRLGDAAPADHYDWRALSADAKRAVVSIRDPETHTSDLWLLDLERGGRVRLTTTPDIDEFSPTWSHDGTRIVFAARRADGSAAIYDMPAGQAGDRRLIVESPNGKSLYVESWSVDDRVLLLTSQSAGGDGDLVSVRIDDAQRPSDRRLVPYQQTRFGENQGRFSPDGRWVAFASDESGVDEVYVDTFPKPTEKHAISIGGGRWPNWGVDGRHLYYEADGKLVAVSIGATAEFVAGRPDVVFDLPKDTSNTCLPTTAGRFFCAMQAPAATSTSRAIINVMVNWMSGLKR